MIRPFPVSISITEPILVVLDRMAERRRVTRSELVRRLVLAEAQRAGEAPQEVTDHDPKKTGA